MSQPNATRQQPTQTELLREIEQTFQEAPYSKLDSTGFLMSSSVVGLIALLVLGNRVRQWHRQARLAPRHGRLFGDALKALDLRFSDRWFLKRMGRAYDAAAPAAVLLTPRLLAMGASAFQRKCGHSALRQMAETRAQSLCRRLFDEPLPEVE